MLSGAAISAVVLWLGSALPVRATGLDGGTTDANLQNQIQTSGPTAAPDAALKTLDLTSTIAPAADFDKLAAVASKDGVARVIVTFRVAYAPEGILSAQQSQAQRAGIAQAGTAVKAALSGTNYQVTHEYASVPSIALLMTAEALQALQASGLAATVQQDTLDLPFLSSSTPIAEATETAVLGRTGLGRKVAVLDTGVDKDHAFIGASQVSNERCFALGSDGIAGAGDCPNGSSSQSGLGSGEDCTYSGDCDHGTHVAGIVMGGPHASSAGAGAAREAKVIPVQVFSNFSGSARSWGSDQLAALDYIFNLPVAVRDTVASVNMSLGSISVVAAHCDGDFRKPAIDNLLSVGIATVIASGNSGSNAGVSTPGCISTAVTVGATDDADNVAGFSNSSSLVDLLAIGVDVTSSIPNADPPPPGAPPYASFNGTSMATPMIAGAFAVLDQVNPGASVATHLAHMQNSGASVTDPDNSVTKQRLRLLAASVLHKDTGFKNAGTFSGLGYRMVSNGVGLATRAGAPAAGNITIAGIPVGATIRQAFLYWTTIGGADKTAVFQGVGRTGRSSGEPRIPAGSSTASRRTGPTARRFRSPRCPETACTRSAEWAGLAASTAREPPSSSSTPSLQRSRGSCTSGTGR